MANVITRRFTGFLFTYVVVKDDDSTERKKVFIPAKDETTARKKAEKSLAGIGIIRSAEPIDEVRVVDINDFFGISFPVGIETSSEDCSGDDGDGNPGVQPDQDALPEDAPNEPAPEGNFGEPKTTDSFGSENFAE